MRLLASGAHRTRTAGGTPPAALHASAWRRRRRSPPSTREWIHCTPNWRRATPKSPDCAGARLRRTQHAGRSAGHWQSVPGSFRADVGARGPPPSRRRRLSPASSNRHPCDDGAGETEAPAIPRIEPQSEQNGNSGSQPHSPEALPLPTPTFGQLGRASRPWRIPLVSSLLLTTRPGADAAAGKRASWRASPRVTVVRKCD